MKTLIATTCLLLIVGGCTSTHSVVEPSMNNPATAVQSRDFTGDRDLVIYFTRGDTAAGKSFSIGRDSCFWIDAASDSSRACPTRDITMVTTKNHVTGFLKGLGIGIPAGLVVGTLAGSMADSPKKNEWFYVPPAAVGAVVGTFAGAVVGAFFGGIEGDTDEYRFVWTGQQQPAGGTGRIIEVRE